MDPFVDSVVPKLQRRIAQIVAQERPPGLAVGIVRDQEWSGRTDSAWPILPAAVPSTSTRCSGWPRSARPLRPPLSCSCATRGSFVSTIRLCVSFPSSTRSPNLFGAIEDVTLLRLLTHRSGLVGESPTAHWSPARFPTDGGGPRTIPGRRSRSSRTRLSSIRTSASRCLAKWSLESPDALSPSMFGPRSSIPLGMDPSCVRVDTGARGWRPATCRILMTTLLNLRPRSPTITAVTTRRPVCAHRSAIWQNGLRCNSAPSPARRDGAQILAGKSLSEMHRVVFGRTRLAHRLWRSHGGRPECGENIPSSFWRRSRISDVCRVQQASSTRHHRAKQRHRSFRHCEDRVRRVGDPGRSSE